MSILQTTIEKAEKTEQQLIALNLERSREKMKIRIIRKEDCSKCFATGNIKFDLNQDGKELGMIFYFERYQSGKYESYVGDEKEIIVGILCLQNQTRCLYLSRLGVAKGHTGKGYGTALAVFTLTKAKEYGLRKLTCKAHKNVWGFFEEIGFVKIQEYEDAWWGKSALFELTLIY